jgi:hypothetical protein
MTTETDQLRALLEKRLTAIANEARDLRAALTHIHDGGAPSSARRRSRRKAPKRVGKKTRARRGERREQLLAAIEKEPGQPLRAMASEIGIAPGQLYPLINKAKKDKLIVKAGKGYKLKT